MAQYSIQRAVSDGTMLLLPLTIKILKQADITVTAANSAGVTIPTPAYSWVSPTVNTIQFAAAVPAGVQITLKRTTSSASMINVFTSGASFTNIAMDTDFTQLLYLTQESVEGAAIKEVFNDLDFHGFLLHNVGTGVAPGDAINKAQLDAYVSDSSGALRADLADTTTAGKGVALVGNAVDSRNLADASVPTKGAGLVGYKSRTVRSRLAELPSRNDGYPSTALAEADVGTVGGTLQFPGGSWPNETPQTVGNVTREYMGPNSIGNVYAYNDGVAVAGRLLRLSDDTNHIGKEGYTLLVENRPKGSTDGTVPGSDFALGVSITKKDWTFTQVEGQACALNAVARSGFFKNPKTITGVTKANPAVVTAPAHGYSNGDVVVIQNVVGMLEVNAAFRFTIAGVTTDTFQLVGINSTAYGTYVSGGIVHKDTGTVGFNAGDTAGYIANVVQSSANSFSAILEGAAYYMPSGSFTTGTKGIRVQLGAIKQTENIAIGVLAVASNGACGAAFQAQNSRSDLGIEGSWNKFLSYTVDFGTPYEAFSVNQVGNIVLNGGTSATTPKKTIRASATNGGLEVVNNAGSAVILQLQDSGSLSIPGVYSVSNVQVVGPRINSWTAPTGTISRGSFPADTADLNAVRQFLGALITDLRTHGLIGT